MKAVLDGEELRSELLAFCPQAAGMRAGQLQSRLPGLRAAVAQEDAIEAGNLSQSHRQLGRAAVIEEVRGVQDLRTLLGDGMGDCRMVVAKRGHADTT
jgi:hypothetical protein